MRELGFRKQVQISAGVLNFLGLSINMLFMNLLCTSLAKTWISAVIVTQLIFGSIAYAMPTKHDVPEISDMTFGQMEMLQQHSLDCVGDCSVHIDMELTACDSCMSSGITADSVPPAVVHSPVIDSLSVVYPVVVYLELNLPPPK